MDQNHLREHADRSCVEQRGFANAAVYLAKGDLNGYKISLNSRKITSAITKQICQQKQRSPGLPSRWDCWKTTSCGVAAGTLPVPRACSAPAPARLERGSSAGPGGTIWRRLRLYSVCVNTLLIFLPFVEASLELKHTTERQVQRLPEGW